MESCLDTLCDVVNDYLVHMTQLLRSAVDNNAVNLEEQVVNKFILIRLSNCFGILYATVCYNVSLIFLFGSNNR